jgi:hypothetical protein
MTPTNDNDAARIDALAAAITTAVNAVIPILDGQEPEVQGAALAELVAMWLASCDVHGDPAITRLERRHLEESLLYHARLRVPVYADEFGTPP